MIDLQDAQLCVGGRPWLTHVDARIAPGEFVAILGPNGAGKTTLLRAIAGLHPLGGGTILLDGRRVGEYGPSDRARRVAFVTGDELLLDALSARDVVAIGRFPHHQWWEWQSRANDADAVAHALAAVGMERFADRLFSTLSSGERQRIWIALGLAQDTPILLLDEPTSHLDVRVSHEILGLLRGLARSGKSVVCALHDFNEAAAYADRIGLIGEGTLLALDEPDALFAGPLLERVYGVAMETIRLAGGHLRIFARDADGASDAELKPSERRYRAPNP
ncbi:MAG TPA: ABC transporter ATP-binding protein [Candidatus Cybelea sp.]|nr:ABC transporter ATP-binding protein [Candidatus Cybelea sp.]